MIYNNFPYYNEIVSIRRDNEDKTVLEYAIESKKNVIIKKIKKRQRKDLSKLRKVLYNICLKLEEHCLRNIASFVF